MRSTLDGILAFRLDPERQSCHRDTERYEAKNPALARYLDQTEPSNAPKEASAVSFGMLLVAGFVAPGSFSQCGRLLHMAILTEA